MPARSLKTLSLIAILWAVTLSGLSLHRAHAAPPDVGPNVLIFDPGMPTSQIQATLDAVANQQVDNEFGAQRYALLFKPGTYGSVATPLIFQVGYYTEVHGLGASPSDVVINGSVNVYNRCLSVNNCVALVNFWRSLSNLTINATNSGGCRATTNFWAVSQGAPMRRVHVNGSFSLMDYCSAPSFASGGFIADTQTTGAAIINGSQQQFLVRDSSIDGWTNAVWNQVFSGVLGAPAQSFPNPPTPPSLRARSPGSGRSCTSTTPASTRFLCQPCGMILLERPGATVPRLEPPFPSIASISPGRRTARRPSTRLFRSAGT